MAAFWLLTARGLGWSTEALGALETGALLHDIGKAGMPHNVLMNPGKLNDEEWAIIRLHPQLWLNLLRDLRGLVLVTQILHSHHERFDGAGYPRQHFGEAIPANASAFSVADTLDALLSDRKNSSTWP